MMNELDYQRILTAFFLRWVQNLAIGDLDPYINVIINKTDHNQGLVILRFFIKRDIKAFWDPTIQIPQYFDLNFKNSLYKLAILVNNITLPEETSDDMDIITYYFLTSPQDVNSFEHLVNIIKLYSDNYPCSMISDIIEDYLN